MEKVTPRLWIVLLVLASFVLLQACASAPKLPDAKPGLYVNEEYRFSVAYPENWQAEPLQGDEVMRAANPNEWKIPVITAAVNDKEGDELDIQQYLDAVKELNPGSKRFKALSQKDLKLNDGTAAKAFTYKWNWADGVTKLQSGALLTIKGDKTFSCTATATTFLGGDTTPEMLQGMCESWMFY
jgi:hypothetical protein